ncbi:hypothetical protein ACWGB8_22590 [Kitasatospora sp. NPDC054939]
MTFPAAPTDPSRRHDLLLSLIALPLLTGATALVAFGSFALMFGAALSDAGPAVLVIGLVGVVLALAPAVLVAVRGARSGYRLLPLVAALSPFASVGWFQLA